MFPPNWYLPKKYIKRLDAPKIFDFSYYVVSLTETECSFQFGRLSHHTSLSLFLCCKLFCAGILATWLNNCKRFLQCLAKVAATRNTRKWLSEACQEVLLGCLNGTAAVTGLVSESNRIVDNVAATPNVALASTTTTTSTAPFLEGKRSCQPATLQVWLVPSERQIQIL